MISAGQKTPRNVGLVCGGMRAESNTAITGPIYFEPDGTSHIPDGADDCFSREQARVQHYLTNEIVVDKRHGAPEDGTRIRLDTETQRERFLDFYTIPTGSAYFRLQNAQEVKEGSYRLWGDRTRRSRRRGQVIVEKHGTGQAHWRLLQEFLTSPNITVSGLVGSEQFHSFDDALKRCAWLAHQGVLIPKEVLAFPDSLQSMFFDPRSQTYIKDRFIQGMIKNLYYEAIQQFQPADWLAASASVVEAIKDYVIGEICPQVQTNDLVRAREAALRAFVPVVIKKTVTEGDKEKTSFRTIIDQIPEDFFTKEKLRLTGDLEIGHKVRVRQLFVQGFSIYRKKKFKDGQAETLVGEKLKSLADDISKRLPFIQSFSDKLAFAIAERSIGNPDGMMENLKGIIVRRVKVAEATGHTTEVVLGEVAGMTTAERRDVGLPRESAIPDRLMQRYNPSGTNSLMTQALEFLWEQIVEKEKKAGEGGAFQGKVIDSLEKLLGDPSTTEAIGHDPYQIIQQRVLSVDGTTGEVTLEKIPARPQVFGDIDGTSRIPDGTASVGAFELSLEAMRAYLDHVDHLLPGETKEQMAERIQTSLRAGYDASTKDRRAFAAAIHSVKATRTADGGFEWVIPPPAIYQNSWFALHFAGDFGINYIWTNGGEGRPTAINTARDYGDSGIGTGGMIKFSAELTFTKSKKAEVTATIDVGARFLTTPGIFGFQGVGDNAIMISEANGERNHVERIDAASVDLKIAGPMGSVGKASLDIVGGISGARPVITDKGFEPDFSSHPEALPQTLNSSRIFVGRATMALEFGDRGSKGSITVSGHVGSENSRLWDKPDNHTYGKTYMGAVDLSIDPLQIAEKKAKLRFQVGYSYVVNDAAEKVALQMFSASFMFSPVSWLQLAVAYRHYWRDDPGHEQIQTNAVGVSVRFPAKKWTPVVGYAYRDVGQDRTEAAHPVRIVTIGDVTHNVFAGVEWSPKDWVTLRAGAELMISDPKESSRDRSIGGGPALGLEFRY